MADESVGREIVLSEPPSVVEYPPETDFMLQDERRLVSSTEPYVANNPLSRVQPMWGPHASPEVEFELHGVAHLSQRFASLPRHLQLGPPPLEPDLVFMPDFSIQDGDGVQESPVEEVGVGSPDIEIPNFHEDVQPSLGSALHANGRCLPCRFHMQAGGCLKGASCIYCHHGHDEWSSSKTVKHFRKHIAEYRAYYYGGTDPTPLVVYQ
eukprot:TRINITY_DN54349_c0_g1_i1.p1 TRINITY_DN54349_c0_g1~~TRINITY_DN54349_c0_g1_i1.p1  ORF type:complete len:209 (+),score=20.50 TRINITY_DN54349_c0_g1_i1:32-658(+)